MAIEKYKLPLKEIIPITEGGTGATTKEQALANLGGLPLIGGLLTGNLSVVNQSGSTEESSLIFLDKDDITKFASIFFNGTQMGVWRNNAIGEFDCKATNGVKEYYINEIGNGYILFYNGFQICFGSFTGSGGGGTVTFVKPFASYCLGVTMTHYVYNGSASTVLATALTNRTTTNFTYKAEVGSGTPTVDYIAWGC